MHRPPVAGDHLSLTGRMCPFLPHQGDLLVLEEKARDHDHLDRLSIDLRSVSPVKRRKIATIAKQSRLSLSLMWFPGHHRGTPLRRRASTPIVPDIHPAYGG